VGLTVVPVPRLVEGLLTLDPLLLYAGFPTAPAPGTAGGGIGLGAATAVPVFAPGVTPEAAVPGDWSAWENAENGRKATTARERMIFIKRDRSKRCWRVRQSPSHAMRGISVLFVGRPERNNFVAQTVAD